MAEVARRQRWDAGTVRVNERDLQLLRAVGENGGTRLELLRLMLAAYAHGDRSEAAARHWTDRMVRGGYLRRAWLLKGAWFTLTPAGGRLVGLVDSEGRAIPKVIEAASVIDHANTLGRLRLHLRREYPEAAWIPERAFWEEQRLNKPVWFRRPDGALDFGDRRVGIEVELTRKHADRYRAIVGQTHPSLTEVWWYCPPQLAPWLGRSLRAAVDRHEQEGLFAGKTVRPFEVRPLPEGVWP